MYFPSLYLQKFEIFENFSFDFFENSEIRSIFVSIKLYTLKNNDAYDEKKK